MASSKTEKKITQKKPEPKPAEKKFSSFFKSEAEHDEPTLDPDAATPKAVTIPKAKWPAKLPAECAALADWLGESVLTWGADTASAELDATARLAKARASGDSAKISAAKAHLVEIQRAVASAHLLGGFDALARVSRAL